MKPVANIPIERSGDWIADLAFDTLMSHKQYWEGNRVMLLKARLPHHQRLPIVHSSGKVYSVKEAMEYWLFEDGVKWLSRMFNGVLPPKVNELTIRRNNDVPSIIDGLYSLSIEDLLEGNVEV